MESPGPNALTVESVALQDKSSRKQQIKITFAYIENRLQVSLLVNIENLKNLKILTIPKNQNI